MARKRRFDPASEISGAINESLRTLVNLRQMMAQPSPEEAKALRSEQLTGLMESRAQATESAQQSKIAKAAEFEKLQMDIESMSEGGVGRRAQEASIQNVQRQARGYDPEKEWAEKLTARGYDPATGYATPSLLESGKSDEELANLKRRFLESTRPGVRPVGKARPNALEATREQAMLSEGTPSTKKAQGPEDKIIVIRDGVKGTMSRKYLRPGDIIK